MNNILKLSQLNFYNEEDESYIFNREEINY